MTHPTRRSQSTPPRICRFLVAVLLPAVAVAGPSQAEEARTAEHGPLRVGLASADVTPPVPFRMSGGFRLRVSTGMQDPLLARAMVLRQGDRAVAIALCDLLGISQGVGDQARRQAARRTGLNPEHIVLAATHTHTGPLYYGARHDYFRRMAIDEHGEDPLDSTAYRDELVRKLADMIVTAYEQAAPAALHRLRAEERTLSFNRRFRMRDGSVRTNPGRLNAEVVEPVGPIDPAVDVLLVREPDGEQTARAALTVFALHLDTIGGTEYAADYPFYLGNVLREALGEELLPLFNSGTSGDINHVDISRRPLDRGHEKAKRIGTRLGNTVVAALDQARPIAQPSLAAASTVVELPLKHFSQQQIAEAHAELADGRVNPQVFEVIKVLQHQGQTLPMRVQAIRLDAQTALVAMPSEIFVELGLAIKERSPFEHTLVLGLTAGPAGYIPTELAFAQGSYEPTNSRIRPGGGEMLVEAALGLLEQLHAER